jgi:hypothetical protein
MAPILAFPRCRKPVLSPVEGWQQGKERRVFMAWLSEDDEDKAPSPARPFSVGEGGGEGALRSRRQSHAASVRLFLTPPSDGAQALTSR